MEGTASGARLASTRAYSSAKLPMLAAAPSMSSTSMYSLVEPLADRAQRLLHRAVVRQTRRAVQRVHRRAVAQPNLEPVADPVRHLQPPLQPFHVSIRVGDVHRAAHEQRARHVRVPSRVHARELSVRGEHLREYLIQSSRRGDGHPSVRGRHDRRHRRQQKVQPRERHQVHRDLVDVHVQRAVEPHPRGEVQK
eukprot:31176-Pelagococcus_subviridis.AAC.69